MLKPKSLRENHLVENCCPASFEKRVLGHLLWGKIGVESHFLPARTVQRWLVRNPPGRGSDPKEKDANKETPATLKIQKKGYFNHNLQVKQKPVQTVHLKNRLSDSLFTSCGPSSLIGSSACAWSSAPAACGSRPVCPALCCTSENKQAASLAAPDYISHNPAGSRNQWEQS